MAVHQQMLLSYPAGSRVLEKVLDATSDTASLDYPDGVQAGDLVILLNWARAANTGSGNTPPDNIATGFTQIDHRLAPGGPTSIGARSRLLYRLANGSESGAIANLITSGGLNFNRLVVFRRSPIITSVSLKNAGGTSSKGNPGAQTITSSGGSPPLLAVASYASTGTVTTRSFSPAEDGEFGSGSAYIKWKIYPVDASPADHSVDMDDNGNFNTLHKCYLELT